MAESKRGVQKKIFLPVNNSIPNDAVFLLLPDAKG
jgi:hypothetical protein